MAAKRSKDLSSASQTAVQTLKETSSLGIVGFRDGSELGTAEMDGDTLGGAGEGCVEV